MGLLGGRPRSLAFDRGDTQHDLPTAALLRCENGVSHVIGGILSEIPLLPPGSDAKTESRTSSGGYVGFFPPGSGAIPFRLHRLREGRHGRPRLFNDDRNLKSNGVSHLVPAKPRKWGHRLSRLGFRRLLRTNPSPQPIFTVIVGIPLPPRRTVAPVSFLLAGPTTTDLLPLPFVSTGHEPLQADAATIPLR